MLNAIKPSIRKLISFFCGGLHPPAGTVSICSAFLRGPNNYEDSDGHALKKRLHTYVTQRVPSVLVWGGYLSNSCTRIPNAEPHHFLKPWALNQTLNPKP